MGIGSQAAKGAAHLAEEVAEKAAKSGVFSKFKNLIGIGGAGGVAAGAVSVGETAGKAVVALEKVSEAASTVTKWGGMIDGAKTVGVVAAVAGVAYLAWQGIKKIFGSNDEEQQIQQGQWAQRVGGSRAHGMSHAEMVRAQAAQGYTPDFNG